ncbi:MAG: type II glyceraldehyde-3-phosphate dehydrogenase [Salinarchaeum sp.]
MIQVGVNGYGTIGKRVADAVAEMPDMALVGISKASANHTADAARKRGYDIYAPDGRAEQFEAKDMAVAGSVKDLVVNSDIIVDTLPEGMGIEHRPLYERHDTPAIFQGGEPAEVASESFTARANYEDARGEDYVRIVSCNTTGLNRLFAPLLEEFGIDRTVVTLVRCRGEHAVISADPVKPPSHHGPDVLEVLPEIENIQTMGMKVPTVRHHMHSINVELESAPSEAAVREVLESESRIHVADGDLEMNSGWDLQEFALDRGRDRMNLYENQVFGDSIAVEDNQLYLFMSIHRESDVIPENIDAIRAVTDTASRDESMTMTNETLGIGGY